MDMQHWSVRAEDLLGQLSQWVSVHVLTLSTFYQLVAVMVALAVSAILYQKSRMKVEQIHWLREHYQAQQQVKMLLFPALWCALQWAATGILNELSVAPYFSRMVASLLTAWVVIRFTSGFVRNQAFASLIAVVAWSIAALSILGLLDAMLDFLDNTAFTLGTLKVSLLSVIEGFITFGLLLWGALFLSRLLEGRINRLSELEPSLKVLFGKLVKIALVVFAIVIGFSSMGIDMSAFAVFGGAIGVGIGFGLQKVISNLVCGVILLLDRSIKPGDVIALGSGGGFGWVNKLGARCVSVRTRDGEEHLIPNEDFITQKVENWSYSDKNVRIKVPVGISYHSDPKKALMLMKEAAAEIPRVLKNPEPVAHLMAFGDSSVNLELRVWVADPEEGMMNVRSQVYQRIWEKFRKAGIEIPFPQRDLHFNKAEMAEIFVEAARAFSGSAPKKKNVKKRA